MSLRILLESVLRNLDGQRIREEDVETLARWQPNADRTAEVPFIVGRVLLQDFTGVPLLVDLAAMRSAVARRGGDIARVQPIVPVDLVIDHSVQVDYFGRADALRLNMESEFRRNSERYQFLKWGAQAFDDLRIVPPGFGICHQVNLESLARGVLEKNGVLYPDTLVGTNSHTTMINGLGVVAWGVGGIEAEAAMLGQPVCIPPAGRGGSSSARPTARGRDRHRLVLRITGVASAGARRWKSSWSFTARAPPRCRSRTAPRSANMAPEYGATIGYFPVDEQSCRYLEATGRSDPQVETVRRYFQAQGLFGMPARGRCDYTSVSTSILRVEPSVAGPKRPQDRITLGQLKQKFLALVSRCRWLWQARS